MKYPEDCVFVGINIEAIDIPNKLNDSDYPFANTLILVFNSEELDEHFYIDFNIYESFRMAMIDYGEVNDETIDYEKIIKQYFDDLIIRKDKFIKIAYRFLDSSFAYPGCITGSFDATDDNVLIDRNGT